MAVFAHGGVQTYTCAAQGTLAPDTIFEAASLSKPVFAAAVLQLAQSGALDLDKPLAAYFPTPYLHSRNPFNPASPADPVADPRLARVTARMVLSHTTGLPNWDRTAQLTFAADPGSRWQYSGEGYLYLQRVVETLTGKPLDVFVAEQVLQPLGMTQSSFVWRPDFAAHAAVGHDAHGLPLPAAHYARPLASSTLYTTVGDYARFVSALLAARPGSAYAAEQTPQIAVRPALQLSWGLGLAIETSSGSIFHWGANPGFQSLFFAQPTHGTGVLFLTNSDNGLDLVDFLVHRYVPGPHPALRFPMLHPRD